MKNLVKSFACMAAACAVLASPAAHALSLTSVVDNGNLVDTSFTSATQISADISYFNAAPVALSFVLDADDVLAGSVSFNSIVRQVSGGALNNITLSLTNGATFSTVGSVATLNDATTASVNGSEGLAVIAMQSPTTEVYVGDPFVSGVATDWRIGFGSLTVGQSFTLTAAPVPEPSSLALAIGGLGALAWVARRRSA